MNYQQTDNGTLGGGGTAAYPQSVGGEYQQSDQYGGGGTGAGDGLTTHGDGMTFGGAETAANQYQQSYAGQTGAGETGADNADPPGSSMEED
jgi:hypothetical protein